MNLKLIGGILSIIGVVALLVGGGMELGVWQYVVGFPFIAVGIGLSSLGKKKALMAWPLVARRNTAPSLTVCN